MSNHTANKLQTAIKQSAFGQGVTPMVARPPMAGVGAGMPSAAPSSGDSPQLRAAINELGRNLERTTGQPERPLSLDEAGQQLGTGLNKTVSNNKKYQDFWNGISALPGRALGAVNNARLAAGKAIGEGAYAVSNPDAWTGGAKPGMTPGVTAPSGNKAAPGLLDQIMKSPYTPYIAGGVGTAGALGLLYAMSRRKKKQQPETEMVDDESDALAYGKAATFGLTGASLGALGGLATSKPGRRNRAVGRGAVIGAGTEIGGITGGALGALLGAGLGGYSGAKNTGGNLGDSFKHMGLAGVAGAGLGALGGGMLGNMAGRGLLEQNPYEDEEEKVGNADTSSADAYYDKKPEKMNTYEASEGVKGLTPKLQYEEHKKMSPQEFGVKASAMLGPAFIAPVAGAALGAGAGALLSKKKDRLRNALLGAGIGGAAGGAAEYALPGVGLGAKYRAQDMYDSVAGDSVSRAMGRVPERVSEVLPYGLQRHSLPGLNAVYGQGPHN